MVFGSDRGRTNQNQSRRGLGLELYRELTLFPDLASEFLESTAAARRAQITGDHWIGSHSAARRDLGCRECERYHNWEADDPVLMGFSLDFGVFGGEPCKLRRRRSVDVNIEEGVDVVRGDGEPAIRF